MKTLAALTVAAVLGLSGCAGLFPQTQKMTRWSRADTTQDQFMKDRYECLKEAETPRGVDCDIWFPCMGARGYVRNDDEGTLYPPEGMQFLCLQDRVTQIQGYQRRAAWGNALQGLGQGITNGVSRPGQSMNCHTDGFGNTNCTSW
jgi:hypothetical protein